jgi:NADH dehydrogenase FAD-containing subunit
MRPRKKNSTVLILGMGDTGVLVASRLSRHFNVIGVSTKPNLLSGQELGKRLSDLPWWQTNYNTPLRHFKALGGVTLVHGKAEHLDISTNSVRIALSNGETESIDYDYLVIASGTSNGFWRTDTVQSASEIAADLSHQAQRVKAASSITVVGGGPTGVSVALNIKRADPSKKVSLCVSGKLPLPGYHPNARAFYQQALSDAGVDLLCQDRVVAVDEKQLSGSRKIRIRGKHLERCHHLDHR